MSPPLMACLAITKAGKHCRNYAQESSYTCSSHKNFFDDQKEIKKILFRGVNNLLPMSLLLHFESKSRWWVETILENQLVQITERDISRLAREETDINLFGGNFWGYFMLLCARHTKDFSYKWNEYLWKKSVRQLWRWSQAIGPVSITWTDLQTMICVRGDCSAFYNGCAQYPELEDSLTEEQWFLFFRDCAKRNPLWFLEFWMTDWEIHLAAIQRIEGPLAQIFRGPWHEAIENYRIKFYNKKKLQNADLKEELIAVAWNEKRFSSWCLDWKEKEELMSRWIKA